MKKKIFGTLVLFASLILTACGGTPTSEGGKSEVESQPVSEQTSSAHKHKYGSWTQTKAPTCTEKGEEEQVCECGEKKTRAVDALGHDWNEGQVTKAATCAVPGEMTYTCKRCGETKKEEIKADHVWDAGEDVVGSATEAAYKVFTCTACNKAKKIEFAAVQETGKYTLSGSLKSDSQFPSYMKLSSNGNSATYVFNSEVVGNAKIYMRGVMDYWHDDNNNNHERNFFSGKNSTDGNFKLEVNGTAVDYSATKSLTYEDMLPGEAQGTYSALGDALVGDCTIQSGTNTIVFTRTESYNMLIKDFVLIFENPSLVG